MMKLIGLKRVTLMAVLLAINLSVLGIYFLSIGPMLDSATMQRDTINGQISELHSKIANVKEDMNYVKDNLPKYNALKDQGFFVAQDRFAVAHVMEDLRLKTGITSFAFSVSDVSEIPNTDADSINYKLVSSRIKVDSIVSPLDANIYDLAQEMPHVLPNYVRIQNMNIIRKAEVTETTLKDIAAGKAVNFVNADLEFDWIKLVPKPTDSSTGPGAAPAGVRR